jgi:carboxypeptidase D
MASRTSKGIPENSSFYTPYLPEYNGGSLAGAGELGYWRSERGLTFYQGQLAGHDMIAFRF